jgi:hypothetical protein
MNPLKLAPSIVLGLFALMNLARGGVHAFSPDGGAGTIAGLFEAYLLAARRDLIVLGLGLQALLTAGAVLNLHFWRPLPVEVPGEIFNMVLLPIVGIAWLLAVYGDRKPGLGRR